MATFEYAAKLICGIQRDPNPAAQRVARGCYATTINIHNPNREPVQFEKKLALTYPPEEQEGGRILPLGPDRLDPDQALKTDCLEIQRKLFPQGWPQPYVEGFVVIQSRLSLDVTAVYTTAAVDANGRVTAHSGIAVEQIRERQTP